MMLYQMLQQAPEQLNVDLRLLELSVSRCVHWNVDHYARLFKALVTAAEVLEPSLCGKFYESLWAKRLTDIASSLRCFSA